MRSIMVHCGGVHRLLTSSTGCQRMAVASPCSAQRVLALPACRGQQRSQQSTAPCRPSTFSHSCHASLREEAARQSLQSSWECNPAWDVLGLGQAMVDFQAAVDDEFLERIGIEKGGRRIISLEERAQILELLDGQYQISAGGSLANTLANMGRLGAANESSGATSLKVAAASIVGCDALGTFHTAQQSQAGVHTLSRPLPESCTGTVIVLTTPDANRTFLSYLGTPQELQIDDTVRESIHDSRVVALEGYVWETPKAAQRISEVVEVSHSCGTLVGMTAGDANVVTRHREEMWQVLEQGIDFLFANRSEAQALLQRECSAEEAALQLGPYCGMVVITDGANGSCISAMGRLQVVPPFWASSKPVDTCGAGDGYAAGFLYGFLTGLDPSSMGRFGARVASTVIAKHGGALSPAEAESLVAKTTVMHPQKSALNPARFSS